MHHKVYDFFKRMQIASKGSLETGGILIGCYRGPHIEILDWTDAGPNDSRTLFSFTKADEKHQKAAVRAWKRSGLTQTYLGEWHTHPIGEPSPSIIDRQTWFDINQKQKRTSVFVIASPQSWRLYSVSGNPKDPAHLVPVEYGEVGITFANPGDGALDKD